MNWYILTHIAFGILYAIALGLFITVIYITLKKRNKKHSG
jgi:tetrahydromethanopterin S-methyltransferase subunit G